LTLNSIEQRWWAERRLRARAEAAWNVLERDRKVFAVKDVWDKYFVFDLRPPNTFRLIN
jgi:hypothetical protein